MHLLVFLSLKFNIYRCIYEILCAIWYHLYNLENGGGVFRLLKRTNGNNCAKHHIYLFLWCLARFQDRNKIEVGSSNAFFLHVFFTIIIFFKLLKFEYFIFETLGARAIHFFSWHLSKKL